MSRFKIGLMRFNRKKGHKYKAKKAIVDGINFDSKLESQVYLLLKADSNIKSIDLQSKVYLTEAKILAKIDFKIELQDGSVRYVEAKGMATPVWNLKKRLWRKYGPSTLEIWGGSYTSPGLVDTVLVD